MKRKSEDAEVRDLRSFHAAVDCALADRRARLGDVRPTSGDSGTGEAEVIEAVDDATADGALGE